MCMEDIRIGSRRWSRVTDVPVGTTVTFPGNSTRVGIKLIMRSGSSTGAGFCELRRSGGANTESFSHVTAAMPTEWITLERDGGVVYSQFDAVSSGNACCVMEVFLDDQQNPPGPPVFPARSVRGPISTATP